MLPPDWYQSFADNYSIMQGLRGKVPSNLMAAYNALMRAGATFASNVQSGLLVNGADAQQWLYSVKQFASHLGTVPDSATLQQNSDIGMDSSTDDLESWALNSPGFEYFWRGAAAAQNVPGQIAGLLQPLLWAALGIGAVVIAVEVMNFAEPERHK